MSADTQTNRSNIWFLGAFSLVLGITVFVGAWILFVGPSAVLGQQQAASLITALEHYYNDQGRYPETATHLIPTYLSRVPTSGWSKPLVYTPCSDGQDYTLGFHRRFGLTNAYWGYTNRLGKWICAGATPPFYENSPCGGKMPEPPRFSC